MKALEILYELVGVRSDTGSAYEQALGEKIHELIAQNDYFKAHPDDFGMEYFDDFLNRPVVWAYRQGKTNKTVLLSGHYDAVEIESYGNLKPYATQPDELKAKLCRTELEKAGVHDEDLFRDIEDENWMFGRGCADMKGGLAAAMEILFDDAYFESEKPECSLLFVAVHDEENISAGMRFAMPLVHRLQKKYALDFKLCLIGEPQVNDPALSDHVNMYAGGAGKVLPMILARGQLSHSAQALEGLNASYMISEIVREIEMNTDYISKDYGICVQPPTVLMQRDLKPAYDVSLVEYAVAAINVLFLESISPEALMDQVEISCKKAMEAVSLRYKKAFEVSASLGAVAPELFKGFAPKVMRLGALIELVKEKEDDFEKTQMAVNQELSGKINKGELTLQQASVSYMQNLMDRSGLREPVVVIGIAPPYYPAVTSMRLPDGIAYIEKIYAAAAASVGLSGSVEPYFAGMGDISYMMCSDAKAQNRLMQNLTLPKSVYDIPFEDIEALSMPSFWMGPRSKAIHQWTERVYKPDIETILPDMMRYMIKHI